MTPSTIHSAYRRYKQDTDSVASWLASTAKKNGYPHDLLRHNDPAAQPAGRLKGKARKLAREATQKSTSKENTDNKEEEKTKKKKPTYIIALSDFVQLANFLATRTPEVVVPNAFITTLSRLIHQRRAFANLLHKHGQSSDANSAKTHGYFVTVLETVRNLLCPLEETVFSHSESGSKAEESTPADPNGSRGSPPTDDPRPGLGNRFANLSVDEPSQSFLDTFAQDSTLIERPSAPEDDSVIYKAEPQTSLEDAYFVYFALVDDLYKIRQDIRSLWVQHLEGLDIAAVAVATNIALSVARGLIQEAMPTLKTITDTFEGGLFNGALGLVIRGYANDKKTAANESSYDFRPRLNELWDKAFVSMLQLYDMIPVGCTWRSPDFVAGTIPDHLSEEGWDLKTEDQRMKECGQIVMQHSSDMSAVIAAMPAFPLEDEILRGLREFQDTGEAPLHLAFSSQVLIDIHLVLNSKIRDTFSRVRAEMDAITKDVLPHLQVLIGTRGVNNCGSNVDLVYLFGVILVCFQDDWIFKARNTLSRHQGDPPFPKADEFRTWMQNPILAGLALFFCRERMRLHAMKLINITRSVMHSAHLYNALQKESLINAAWDDMDCVLSVFGDLNFWVGGDRPAETSDYLRKYYLQEGYSMTNFTKKSRHKKQKLVRSRHGPRELKRPMLASSDFPIITLTSWKAVKDFASTLVKLQAELFESYSPFEHGSFHWEKERLEKLLERSDSQAWLDYAALVENLPRGDSSGLEVMLTCRATALVFDQESKEMAFPYMKLHHLCRDLMVLIMQRCQRMINELAPKCGLDDEVKMTTLTQYILTIIDTPSVKSDQLREAVARAFTEWLSEGHGDVCLRTPESLGKHMEEGADMEETRKRVREGLHASLFPDWLRVMLSPDSGPP